MRNFKSLKLTAFLGGTLLFSGLAYAADCDLTTGFPSECTVNSAIFQSVDPQATGTGLIDPFVQTSGAGNLTETESYNTLVNDVLNNTHADNWNHPLSLSEVPIVNIGGTDYYEFVLDINESVGGGDNFLSLDEVQVFSVSFDNRTQSVETFTGGVLDINGTLVYRLDSNEDNVVLLDYSFNSGSGSGDMNMYIPVSAFPDEYVILYSHFGGEGDVGSGCSENPQEEPCRHYGTSDGFEEWTHHEAEVPVPEPATLILLGTGLLGIAGKVRRRMKI